VAKALSLPARVRDRVVELIAQTDHATHAWQHGARAEDAKKLGVELDVLEEAAARARSGASTVRPPVFCDLLGPVRLMRPFAALAERLHMERADLLRSMLHAVLQTPREPTKRPGRQWKPLLGRESVRSALGGSGSRAMHFKFKVSAGFLRALEQRAVAGGETTQHYIKGWMADLVDGLLADLTLVPVSLADLFEDERAYVLPRLTTPSETATVDRP